MMLLVSFCKTYSINSLNRDNNELQQGNIFTSVCQEFCPQGEGLSASVHAGIHPHTPWADTPLGRHPLGRHYPGQIPPGQTPPWTDSPPQQPLQQTIHILLECFVVGSKFKKAAALSNKFELIAINKSSPLVLYFYKILFIMKNEKSKANIFSSHCSYIIPFIYF